MGGFDAVTPPHFFGEALVQRVEDDPLRAALARERLHLDEVDRLETVAAVRWRSANLPATRRWRTHRCAHGAAVDEHVIARLLRAGDGHARSGLRAGAHLLGHVIQ